MRKHDFKVKGLVVNKKNIYSHQLRENTGSFYNHFVQMIIQRHSRILVNASIKMDGNSNKEFNKSIRTYLRQNIGEKRINKFKFVDSKRDNLIQLADMVVGAIARFHNANRRDTDRWYKILKDKIDDIWSFG